MSVAADSDFGIAMTKMREEAWERHGREQEAKREIWPVELPPGGEALRFRVTAARYSVGHHGSKSETMTPPVNDPRLRHVAYQTPYSYFGEAIGDTYVGWHEGMCDERDWYIEFADAREALAFMLGFQEDCILQGGEPIDGKPVLGTILYRDYYTE